MHFQLVTKSRCQTPYFRILWFNSEENRGLPNIEEAAAWQIRRRVKTINFAAAMEPFLLPKGRFAPCGVKKSSPKSAQNRTLTCAD